MDRRARHGAALFFLSLFGVASAACGGPTSLNKFSLPPDVVSCTTWAGHLTVGGFGPTPTADGRTPRDTLTPIQLPNLGSITGDLEFSDIEVYRPSTSGSNGPPNEVRDPQGANSGNDSNWPPELGIFLPSLTAIGGGLTLRNITNAKLVPKFPELNSVGGITFEDVVFADNETTLGTGGQFPALNYVQFMNFAGTNIAHIGPFERTLLASSNALKTGLETSIIVRDNGNLESIELDGWVESKKTNIEILGNSLKPSVTFSSIQRASLALSGISGFEADDLLSVAPSKDGDIQKITVNTFTNLNFPKLTQIEDTLLIQANNELTTVDFPELENAGHLEILNNANLASVSIQATATGNVEVDSAGTFNCKSLRVNVPNADVKCPSASPLQSGSSSTPAGGTASMSSSDNGGLSSGAKIGIGVGAGIGGALLIAAAVFCFCCRGRRRSSNTTREISTEGYSKAPHSYNESGDLGYSKFPYQTDSAAQMREPQTEDNTPTSMMAHTWSPPEHDLPMSNDYPMSHRVELEEQQGPRHEMDARSLPDMDSEEDDEAETRSLEDIERVHRQR